MLLAHRTGDTKIIAGVARIVVIADFLFTASAVIAQPLTGVWLAYEAGYALTESWIVLSIILYLVTGAFWLPVVWMQLTMRDLAREAADQAPSCPPPTTRISVGGSLSAFPRLPRSSLFFG